MKKRVRVYKAGGESNQPTQEQIVSYISQRMSADDFDGDTNALKAELRQAGIDDAMANNYIAYVSENLDLEDNSQLDEETQAAAEQEQASTDEEQALLEEQQATEDQARKQQLAAMYNTDIDMSTTQDTAEDEESYMRQGGTNLNKRSFIKQYTKFAKMAQGGDTPSPGADDVLNGREAHVKGFLGAVRNTAQDAALREEAENQYNSAYGAPQVGAFQEGGIHQEETDFENPLHHLSTYGADTRHIFSDDMYTQNDVAAMEQFGGNTGQGLYKFIGGGDNESADEEYQDADIDFNQEEYQMGGFRMPRRSGKQYTQAVNSPYYTATGERAAAPDLVNRQVSSVDVTKRGIFGRPKAYTVNYGNPSSTVKPTFTMPTEDQAKVIDAKNAAAGNAPKVGNSTCSPSNPAGCKAPEEKPMSNQPIANWMMRTGIPGLTNMGASMIKSKQLPEYDVKSNDPDEIKRVKRFHPGYQPFSQNEEQVTRNYDNPPFTEEQQKYLTQSLRVPEKTLPVTPPVYNGTIPLNTAGPANTNFTDFENQKQIDQVEKIKALQSAQKEYGGPVDYTQYAYGGDISVPDLYRAQVGTEVAFDPNANNTSFANLQGFFDKAPTKDVAGNPIQPTVPESMQPKNITIDPNQPNRESVLDQPDNVSQDFESKKNWDKTRDNFDLGKAAVEGVLDINDKVNARKQENQMLANTTSAEANYGISNADDRGDYDPNSGLFRPDQMGAMQSKYGGGIYATGGSTEDEDEDTQYMTQEEIDDFIANGGELEYL